MGLKLRSGTIGRIATVLVAQAPVESIGHSDEIGSDRAFFDVTLKDDPGFKLVAGGWHREFCSLCHWELNADGGPAHADGYTNGREWLCAECYEKFLEPREKAGE